MSAKKQDDPPVFPSFILPDYYDPLWPTLVAWGMPEVAGYKFSWLGSELTDKQQFHKYALEAFCLSSEEVSKEYETPFIYKAPRFNEQGKPEPDKDWIPYYRYVRRLTCEDTPDIRYEQVWNCHAEKYEAYISGLEDVPLYQQEEQTALLMAGISLIDMAGQQYGNRKGYSREEVTRKLLFALDQYVRDEYPFEKINWTRFARYFGQVRTNTNYYFNKFPGLRKEFDERLAVLQERYEKVSNKS